MQPEQAIAAEWLGCVLRAYPGQTAAFLSAEKDQFRNPIGHTLSEALAVLLDELLGGMDPERVRAALDAILQIRAVEDRPASQAIDFLFQLKPILARHLTAGQLELLHGRIDEMALAAFDIFVQYRERTWQARANEARRRVFVLERFQSRAREQAAGGTD